MSEKQRLITKYVAHLSIPVAAKYHLHFLRGETDTGAIHMLKDTLTQIAKETGNTAITDCMTRIGGNPRASINFGNKRIENGTAETEDSHVKVDYAGQALGKFRSLCLESALADFNAAKREQKSTSHPECFYHQRAEINLVQGRYAEALSLALKGNWKEMIFVAAIANKDFEIASDYLTNMIGSLRAGIFDKGSIVSSFEIIHLIMFLCFATKSCEETEDFLANVRSATNYDMGSLYDIAELFTTRKLAQFLARMDDLAKMWGYSIYTCHVVDELKKAIIQNVVVNQVKAYSRVSLSVLDAELRFSAASLKMVLVKAIRDGKLSGRIDFKGNEFIGSDSDLENLKNERILTRAVVIKEKFENTLWKKSYVARRF